MESGIGFRFHPTEGELVNHYLRLKVLGYEDQVTEIPELVNVLDYEPWQLPNLAISEMMMSNNSNDQVWYFFCPRIYKYAKSQRANRTTNAGHWKVTGKDRKIQNFAIKKTLVFYRGRTPGDRTNWIMHEYNPTFNFQNQRDFVLCKLKKRPDAEDGVPIVEEGESSTTNYGNNAAEEDDSQLQAHVGSFQSFNEMDYNLNSAMQWPSYY